MPTISKIKIQLNPELPGNSYDIHDTRLSGVTNSIEDGNSDVVTSNGVYDYILQNCVIARDIEEE